MATRVKTKPAAAPAVALSKSKRDQLIRRGIAITRQLAELNAELAELKEKLAPCFPGEKTIEEFMTPAGLVRRTLSRSYAIEPMSVLKVRQLLGDQYPEYITEKSTFGLTAKMRELVSAGDSALGLQLRELVTQKESVSISFKPAAEGV